MKSSDGLPLAVGQRACQRERCAGPLPRGGQAEPPVLRGSMGYLAEPEYEVSQGRQRSWPWRGPPPRRHPLAEAAEGFHPPGRRSGGVCLVVSLCIRWRRGRREARPEHFREEGREPAAGSTSKRLTWTGPSVTCGVKFARGP